jgi:hypothetical protein
VRGCSVVVRAHVHGWVDAEPQPADPPVELRDGALTEKVEVR